MPALKLSKSNIDKLPIPDAKPVIYRDTDLKSFGLMVHPSGLKTFIVEKRIGGGSPKRKVIGRYGVLTPDQARRQAQAFLGKVAIGEDPITEIRHEEARAITLSAVFELYLKVHPLKPSTIHDYRRTMHETFSDWLNRPLAAITKDMVGRRHKQRGEKSPARADNAMRVLQAVFNFARGQYEDEDGQSLFPENPVSRLSDTRAWYRVGRRRTLITAASLPEWFKAVQGLKTDAVDLQAVKVADFLLLCLFTGLRRGEAMSLKWSDIDFTDRTLTIQDTKNHEPLRLPLSTFLHDLLQGRWRAAESAKAALKAGAIDAQDKETASLVSAYVFPGAGKQGYMVEPRAQMDKVVARSGVTFTLHDLRRTFITVAESLDISVYAIKRLVNHKLRGDVTAGYVVGNVERLREPMQKVTDALLKSARYTPPPPEVTRDRPRRYLGAAI